ncbi:MAG: elongation factor P [Planctomycetota bacterium]
MISSTDIRKGMMLDMEGELYVVMDFQHVAKGNKRSYIQTKLRNLKTGNQAEQRLRADDKVNQVFMEQLTMEYLYEDRGEYVFMNMNSHEQFNLSKELVEDTITYLIPNIEVKVDFYNQKPIGIHLPITVDLKITETEPGLKGATVTNVYKSATTETGLIVQVPPFINNGEVIRVDTRDGRYVERVK